MIFFSVFESFLYSFYLCFVHSFVSTYTKIIWMLFDKKWVRYVDIYGNQFISSSPTYTTSYVHSWKRRHAQTHTWITIHTCNLILSIESSVILYECECCTYIAHNTYIYISISRHSFLRQIHSSLILYLYFPPRKFSFFIFVIFFSG